MAPRSPGEHRFAHGHRLGSAGDSVLAGGRILPASGSGPQTDCRLRCPTRNGPGATAPPAAGGAPIHCSSFVGSTPSIRAKVHRAVHHFVSSRHSATAVPSGFSCPRRSNRPNRAWRGMKCRRNSSRPNSLARTRCQRANSRSLSASPQRPMDAAAPPRSTSRRKIPLEMSVAPGPPVGRDLAGSPGELLISRQPTPLLGYTTRVQAPKMRARYASSRLARMGEAR
jgi:hypothetical protein